MGFIPRKIHQKRIGVAERLTKVAVALQATVQSDKNAVVAPRLCSSFGQAPSENLKRGA
jgi:hypothetical protein